MFGEPRGPVTWNSSKHEVLAYSGEFCKLLLTDFGFRCDPNDLGTPGSGYGSSSQVTVLVYSCHFCMLLLADFGSRCDPNVLATPGSGYRELVKTHGFGLFRLVLYANSH